MFLDKLEFRSDHLLFRSFDPKLLPATLCFSFSAAFLSNIYEEVKAGKQQDKYCNGLIGIPRRSFLFKICFKETVTDQAKIFAFCSVIEHEKFS